MLSKSTETPVELEEALDVLDLDVVSRGRPFFSKPPIVFFSGIASSVFNCDAVLDLGCHSLQAGLVLPQARLRTWAGNPHYLISVCTPLLAAEARLRT